MERYELLVLSGANVGNRIELPLMVNEQPQCKILVGRADNADFKLASRAVSARHAQVNLTEQGCLTITDLGSKNGTRIKHRGKLEANAEIRITGGDEIKLADVLIEVRKIVPDSAAPTVNLGEVILDDWNIFDGWRDIPLAYDGKAPTIPPFKFISTLSKKGGFGDVWKVQDQNGKVWALKISKGSFMGALVNNEGVFKREVYNITHLKHPSLIRYGGVHGQYDGHYFYTMDYCEGGTLQAYIKRENKPRRFLYEQAVRLLDGLDYLHKKNFRHRDIKPDNLLVHDGMALICDYSLTKSLDFTLNLNLTQGNTYGSLEFISCDQALHYDNMPPSGDLFSLAASLYFIETGRHVYPTGCMADVTEKNIVPIAYAMPLIEPELRKVYDKALYADGGNGYETAEEMRGDILKVLADPEITIK